MKALTTLAAIALLTGSLLAGKAAKNAPGDDGQKRKTSFQYGVDGYSGTTDIELWQVSPDKCLEGNPNATTDAQNGGGESQILLRFDNIFGDKQGQIPSGSAIQSAKVIVSAFDPGDTVHLHRMLVPWKRTATWNSMVAGVTANGLEASKQKDGWVFINTGGNGWDFYTSEFEDAKQRPKLIVEFSLPKK
jgi:hypothetical protein